MRRCATLAVGTVLAACLGLLACVPPWQFGRRGARARAAGEPVLELAALAALERQWRLDAVLRAQPTDAELARLAELLAARAAAFHALGRPIAESRDLETVTRLDPVQGRQLAAARAAAATAAGDVWKSVGARDEARAAFSLAARLGGVPPGTTAAPPVAPAPPPTLPADVDAWVLGGAALSARLLPLVNAFPAVLDDGPRALRWADLLLDEDPSSPDDLELVATIFGRAGRFGGTERMLMEMTFYTPDRAAALARGALVWERLGRPREACAQWIRAARWRDQPEDLLWVRAIDCARRDPGAGSWEEIRAYVLGRARPEERATLAIVLDGVPGAPASSGSSDAGDAGAPSVGRPDGSD
jgi:hypothetical protein